MIASPTAPRTMSPIATFAPVLMPGWVLVATGFGLCASALWSADWLPGIEFAIVMPVVARRPVAAWIWAGVGPLEGCWNAEG